MSFCLSDDQEQLFEAIECFSVEQCDDGVRRRAFEGQGHDPGFWQGLGELGVLGLGVAEQHGGMGLGLLELALAAEALGYAGAPGPFLGHALAALTIDIAGSETQKAKWLPRLAAGEVIGSIALGEPGSRWSPADWQACFENGRISGTKTRVLDPGAAGLLVVGLAEGELALVARPAAGVQVTELDVTDRTRRLCDIVFSEAPAERLTESPGAIDRVIDAGLVLLAADAFGGGRRVLDMSVAYACMREQFGMPIGRFQALKHQLAQIALDIEPLRGLYWYAAHAWDQLPEERSRMAAMAKAHACDRFTAAARAAVEAHGGIGYTWEHDIQIWLKRAIFDHAWLGTPATHRSRAAVLAGW
jgi:alkylation response protein AidB-like acyl-CoA dehydrogenase